jgi:hypothetical protein
VSSLDRIREALDAVARGTSDARGSLVHAEARLEEAARMFADLDGDTHEKLPADRMHAAHDDVAAVLGSLDRAAGIVDDLAARL